MEVSGSILNKNNLYKNIEILNDSNVNYIHLDIMDGKFVDNKFIKVTELPKIIEKIRKPIDVHLMVSNPEQYINSLSLYNIFYITIHYEIKDFEKYIDIIKNLGFRVGLSIKPKTNIEDIYKYLDKLNLVLIMSVEPGKSGQEFIVNTEEKINKLKEEIKKRNLSTKISVDGGINNETKKYVENADILVSSSYILNNINNIEKLQEI